MRYSLNEWKCRKTLGSITLTLTLTEWRLSWAETQPPTKDTDKRHQNYLVRFSKRTHLQAGVPVVMEMPILSTLETCHIIAISSTIPLRPLNQQPASSTAQKFYRATFENLRIMNDSTHKKTAKRTQKDIRNVLNVHCRGPLWDILTMTYWKKMWCFSKNPKTAAVHFYRLHVPAVIHSPI